MKTKNKMKCKKCNEKIYRMGFCYKHFLVSKSKTDLWNKQNEVYRQNHTIMRTDKKLIKKIKKIKAENNFKTLSDTINFLLKVRKK